MIRRRFAVAAALLLLAVPAAASAMSVGTFLAKADALQKRGPMALFSKDIGVLKAELGAAGKSLRADQAAAAKTGGKRRVCVPAKAKMHSDELLAYFRTIPPATSVKDGFAGLMARKYPCPA